MPREKLWAGTEESLQAYIDAEEKGASMEVRAEGDDEEELPYLLDIEGNVGVISIKGTLTNRDSYWNRYLGVTSYNAIREAMVAAASDPDIHNILLDIDSGGGAVNGVMDTANLIRMINDKVKPVTAFADGTMASGAYWLGMAAGNVLAGKTAVVGSIGVISTHMEYSKQLKEEGVGVTVMRAGKFKALANPYEPLSEAGKANLQTMLDATYNVFIEHVATMRGKTAQYVDDTMAQGREFIGEAAVGVGLVDGITTYDALMTELQREPLDNNEQFKQESYQYQQDPYSQRTPMKRKVLTQQQIAAIAEGGLTAEQTQELAASTATEEAPPTQEASTTATQEANPGEVAEGQASSETQEALASVEEPAAGEAQAPGIVTYLQAQIIEKDAALLAANVELAQIRKEHEEFAACIKGLSQIAAHSISNMLVALNGTAISADSMSPTALLAEHSRVSEQFLSKFKAGGVAAVDAADASVEDVRIDPLHAIRLASVRATVKAKK